MADSPSLLLNVERAMSKSTKNSEAKFRRPVLAGLVVALALSFALPAQAREMVRIGYQKSSTLITLLKTQGTLDKTLAQENIDVSWHEFPSGLPLLEALNVGNVDISADVADTVPIFAQAAQARLTYFAQEAPSPSAQAIVVHKDSPLQQLSDLKGKKVAVTKAAGAHYLLIAALKKAGLEFPTYNLPTCRLPMAELHSRTTRSTPGSHGNPSSPACNVNCRLAPWLTAPDWPVTNVIT
jgi:sulfonate transport system substrate-binding protein